MILKPNNYSNIPIASTSGWHVLVKDLDDGHENDESNEYSNIPIARNSRWQVVVKDLDDYEDDDDYNCDDEADNDDSGGVAHDKHDAHSPIASTSQWVAGC